MVAAMFAKSKQGYAVIGWIKRNHKQCSASAVMIG